MQRPLETDLPAPSDSDLASHKLRPISATQTFSPSNCRLPLGEFRFSLQTSVSLQKQVAWVLQLDALCLFHSLGNLREINQFFSSGFANCAYAFVETEHSASLDSLLHTLRPPLVTIGLRAHGLRSTSV